MFIAIEGHDGLGKTTQVRLLSESLTKQGYDVLVTHSPGGCPEAEELRNLALYSTPPPSANVRSWLTQSSRMENWTRLIKPHLAKKNAIVITDRWHWSGYLYQCVGEGTKWSDWVKMSTILEEAIPDLTIVLNMDEEQRQLLVQNHAPQLDVNGKLKPPCVMEAQGLEFEARISKAITEGSMLDTLANHVAYVEFTDLGVMANKILEVVESTLTPKE